MLPSLLITLREGLEAALLLGLLLAVLARAGDIRAAGAGSGWASQPRSPRVSSPAPRSSPPGAELEGSAEAAFEAGAMLAAALVLAWMIVWMGRRAHALRGELGGKVAAAAGSAAALFWLGFVLVVREGLETGAVPVRRGRPGSQSRGARRRPGRHRRGRRARLRRVPRRLASQRARRSSPCSTCILLGFGTYLVLRGVGELGELTAGGEAGELAGPLAAGLYAGLMIWVLLRERRGARGAGGSVQPPGLLALRDATSRLACPPMTIVRRPSAAAGRRCRRRGATDAELVAARASAERPAGRRRRAGGTPSPSCAISTRRPVSAPTRGRRTGRRPAPQAASATAAASRSARRDRGGRSGGGRAHAASGRAGRRRRAGLHVEDDDLGPAEGAERQHARADAAGHVEPPARRRRRRPRRTCAERSLSMMRRPGSGRQIWPPCVSPARAMAKSPGAVAHHDLGVVGEQEAQHAGPAVELPRARPAGRRGRRRCRRRRRSASSPPPRVDARHLVVEQPHAAAPRVRRGSVGCTNGALLSPWSWLPSTPKTPSGARRRRQLALELGRRPRGPRAKSPVMTIEVGPRREREVDGLAHGAQVEARPEAGVEVRELHDGEAVEVRRARPAPAGAGRRGGPHCASSSM